MSRFKGKALAAFAVLVLGACVTIDKTNLPPPPETGGATQDTQCNPALAALIGGAVGAVIHEEDRARGAAVGAGLGALACSIINASTRQTRSQGDVEQEYRASHRGELPDRPLVGVYDTAYNAGGSVRAGQEARVVSSITLVPGAKERIRDLREVLEILEPGREDDVVMRAEKRVEDAARAGAIQNIFSIRLPQGMAAGNYPARTTLYVNEKAAGENRGTLRVLGGQ